MSPKLQTHRLKNKLSEQKRLQELNVFENKVRSLGFKRIAGIDEAGRGPLAGPVVAAVCVIEEGVFFEGIDDSKKLTPKKRQSLFQIITHHEKVNFAFGIVDSEIIDSINIYQATIKAMFGALDQLLIPPDYLLVDGMQLSYNGIPSEKIIGGDGLSQSIAAASIIAKEVRDALMIKYHQEYPVYHFDQHKGYGTELHREMLKKFGPCQLHRRSFEPVRESLIKEQINLIVNYAE